MDIFKIKSEEEFEAACLETFQYQVENVGVYQKFVQFLGINPQSVNSIKKIPFLPIEIFKKHQVSDRNFKVKNFFQSSGTTDMVQRSKHYIADHQLYERSIDASFTQFIGPSEEFIFLGLLPNYSENKHSSLIYMVDYLMNRSGKPENGYFLYNHAELFELMQNLTDKKVILFGVSFALLDFLDFIALSGRKMPLFPNLTVLETGGMKGRKEEMTKDQLIDILQKGFRTERIFSEYSMTELLSQAYSIEDQQYQSPNWMKILIRSTEDPFSYLQQGRTGVVNIIDLANRHSCSFIATQDLGRIVDKPPGKTSMHPAFQISGRIDHSDLRGCSLLVS